MPVSESSSELRGMKLVRRREVADTLACSLRHVDNLILSGELEPIRIGPKGVRVTLKSLERFLGQ